MDRPRNSAQASARPGHDRGLGGVDVQVARAGMVDVAAQHALEHVVETLDGRRRVVARAAPRLEQEERVGVEHLNVQVVGIARRNLLHRVAVRAILFDARRRVELLDVADRQRLDQVALDRRRPLAQRHRLLDGRVRVRRLGRRHRSVQVRSPGPRFAPVTVAQSSVRRSLDEINLAAGVIDVEFVACERVLAQHLGQRHIVNEQRFGLIASRAVGRHSPCFGPRRSWLLAVQ